MAAHLRRSLARVKAQVARQIPIQADINQLARDVGHAWRDRLLTPAVTMQLFLLQILNGHSAITALRHIGDVAMQASSYCAARARLPLELFTRLFDAVAQQAANLTRTHCGAELPGSLLNGRRVLLADCTTFSMPDTPALRDHFGYPPGQRAGLGFPVSKLLGVIDAMTGAILTAMACPLFSHEAREMLSLHPLLKKGDVLVADRGFCSYAQIALLMLHGVDVVMRLHQRRPLQWAKDQLVTWTRPPAHEQPQWMSPALWLLLPEQLNVRIVRYTVPRRGYRTRVVYVATTLADALTFPPETIMRLYGHRWNIETCFNQLKTHAKMNTLKCQTVDGVVKELIMYLIVWNLLRMTMARFARTAGVSVWRVSFIDAMRCLCALLNATPTGTVSLMLNPDRPGRWEPRKLKRRMKEYDLLKEPRQRLKSKHRARYA